MTIPEMIIAYLEEFGSITTMEAASQIGTVDLRKYISDLRRGGYDIKDKVVTSTNRYGHPVSYKRYYMEV